MTTMDAVGWLWIAVLAIALSVIGYTLLLRRLAELAQEMRLGMADVARELLTSDLGASDKRTIRFMLTHAFSPWPAAMMALYLPIQVVRLIGLKLLRRPGLSKGGPPNAECELLARRFMLSTLAANPIAALVLVVEMLTIGFVGFLVGGQVLLARAVFAAQKAEERGPLGRLKGRLAV